MYITGKALPRRTVLAGLARRSRCRRSTRWSPALAVCRAGIRWRSFRENRLVCIEIVHGAAGSTQFGGQRNLWAPVQTGRDFDLTGTA